MKDVVFYVFLLALYGILGLHFFGAQNAGGDVFLSWHSLGFHFCLFLVVATLARWSVLAFKRRADRLLKGQQIVGVEEGEAERVIDILKPAVLRREEKKPKLKRGRS